MKTSINKSAKRVLSIALACAMLIGTLFTANVGVNLTANAETAPIAEGTVDLLEFGSYLTEMGSSSQWYDTKTADNGESGDSWDDPIIIDSAEEFVYIAKTGTNDTAGKYYKVADGIAGFNLSGNSNLVLDGTLADNLAMVKASGKNHAGATPGFQGHFDGNGVTVYGAWTNHNEGNVSDYAGLFSCTKGNVTIKNVNVKFGSFTAKTAAGGIVGYHSGDGTETLTIENCSVTDTHIELTTLGNRHAIGAIVGISQNLSSWSEATEGKDGNGDGDMEDIIYVNGRCLVNNCFVNLDPDYFISATDPDVLTDTSKHGTFGGVVGGMTSNGLAVNGCVVIGVTPYTTQVTTATNEIQHTGLASHYTNVYTTEDVDVTDVFIGGTLANQNFTGIHPLSTDKMKGSAAVNNMGLAWFSAWTPGAEGEYPTLNQTGAESDTSFWSGAAASGFAGGTGTKDDPFIIKTADQLYLALTQITYTTSTSGDLAVGTAESVAGGTQTDRILEQGSTTVYVPVYTPYYYKVADGVKSFYLNNVYGNETLAGAKAMAAGTKIDWKPGKSFVGHLDGNGVTIYGMYSSTGQGLVYKLDGSSTVKNFNFDSCYSTSSGRSAMVTTNLGSYKNDSTIINVSNISVRNSYIGTSYVPKATARTDTSGCYDLYSSAAGIIATTSTAEALTISNCLFDGPSCERLIGAGSDITVDMVGGIISGGTSMNNVVLNGCVSLGAPIVDEGYVAGKELHYTRYDANQGFPVHFYDCYTDMAVGQLVAAYPGKYDKLSTINRVEETNVYEKYDMPTLTWGSNWSLVSVDDSRVIPMPGVNTADKVIGSYSYAIAGDYSKYSSVGPYKYGSNPFTYSLKGSGTEEDPYLIETDLQLARAIATGGMNLYDKLYYKLANDIDLSGGLWINQVHISGSYYTYTPFGGVLDGDGHTITGLSAGDISSAGLIPVLDGGTVKNLHVRGASVISSNSAGVIVGEIIAGNGGAVIGCSAENAVLSAESFGDGIYVVGYHDDIFNPEECGDIQNCYFIGEYSDSSSSEETSVYITKLTEDDGIIGYDADGFTNEILSNIDSYKDVWYIGGKEGSVPRLINHAKAMKNIDVIGDGKSDSYGSGDLAALRNRLLKKDAYKNICGDVSRNGKIDIVDLAVLQRTMVNDYGVKTPSDGFWANVEYGTVDIYYGENDNYDAARKVELYLESIYPDVDVRKHVSSSKGTVSGDSSDSSKVYLHASDTAGSPDGKLDIIVGTLDNVAAYNTNTVATAANTYAVTYDSTNHVIWIQGENFTAVEQAVLDFIAGSDYKTSTVFSCGSTELEDYKKPRTVKLDTDYDGKLDTDTVLYYAWGDEFEEDTLNTHNWQHNSQQSEGSSGVQSNYKDQEVAPVKDLNKVIVVQNGRLSMKRGFQRGTNGVNADTENGYIALDVTPGEYNGYKQDGVNAIDADGSDRYFSSGKITTERGMLFKQGYLEFEGQLPADGHAFPAWWLMGRPSQSQTNQGYDNSLYGKVYKLNSNWNGANDFDEDVLDTYKYQIPSAIYEIDMIEVMQAGSRISGKDGLFGLWGDEWVTKWDTAVGWYAINSTIHKWWNNGVDNQGTADTSDDRLWIADWDNYKVVGGITNSAFKTTSSAGSWIHNPGSTEMDFGTSSNSQSINATARDDLQKSRKYGFSWYTDAETGFEATLYVYNDDGSVRQTLPIASGASIGAMKDSSKNTEANGAIGANAGIYSDAKVFNQYMYILLDNKFYSANEKYDGGAKVFTDLLTAAGLTSLEVDYMRLYQRDGERDIVTQETESFNNNNHFGYK